MNSVIISGRTCHIYGGADAGYILIQPCDEEEMKNAEQVFALASEGKNAALFAFRVADWNCDLSPWAASPAFGKEPFGGGGSDTLDFITGTLVPYIIKRQQKHPKLILGGYSLAGLFSLWSAYQTDIFDGVAAVSPSVWFDGWMDYIRENKIKTSRVYLSLGDREHKIKNQKMKTVADCIRIQYEHLQEKDVCTVLEWNEGNHFTDCAVRMAKGFRRCMAL